jgi:hypothetical protein
MIDVYLRSSETDYVCQLAKVSNAREVQELYELVRNEGVYVDGNLELDITMQFCLDEDDAYVEFVILQAL